MSFYWTGPLLIGPPDRKHCSDFGFRQSVFLRAAILAQRQSGGPGQARIVAEFGGDDLHLAERRHGMALDLKADARRQEIECGPR